MRQITKIKCNYILQMNLDKTTKLVNNTFTEEKKREIANSIKQISLETVNKEFDKLVEIGYNADQMSPRSRIGNNVVDYFTFYNRLHTKGKYDVNFFDFLANLEEFKKKKFIQTMLTYYQNVKNKTNTKNEYIVYKEVYNICISAINIIRPLVYMEIYAKYRPKKVLDFCAGWGGALIAAAALRIDQYTGVEINTNLQTPYANMVSYLKTSKNIATKFDMHFTDALTVDYSAIEYDLVFTSPPYYFIQKYENNALYKSKKEMDELFYIPIFTKTYNGLKSGGYYIINVCKEVYENVLEKLFGLPLETYPYKKSQRQNNYSEIVYVWKKP